MEGESCSTPWTCKGSRGIAPAILTSAVNGGEGLVSRPGPFIPFIPRIVQWISPRTVLDGDQKNLLTGIEHRPLGHPARRLVVVPNELCRLPTKRETGPTELQREEMERNGIRDSDGH
jgi:hypothetical protein